MNRLALVSLSLAVVSACNSSSPAGDGGSTPQVLTGVRGIVTSNGAPLANVAVVSAKAVATTDSTGRFTLQAPVGATTVRFTLAGYVEVVKAVTVLNGVPTMQHVTMLPAVAPVRLGVSDGGIAAGSGGSQLKVPPNAFVTAGGQVVTGDVQVRLTHLDPTTAATRRGVSGDFSADTTQGTAQLESTGMVDIDVRSAGQKVSVANAKTLEVRLPVAQGVTNPPATMELWSFDDAKARWVSEGTATLDAASNTYVATIAHMSLWNTDKPYLATCVAGCVVDESNASLPGALVSGSGVDYLGESETHTDLSGCFRLAVRKDSSVDLTAVHQLGGGVTRRFQSADGGTAVPPGPNDVCLDAGVFTVKKDVYTTSSGTVNCSSVMSQFTGNGCLAAFGMAMSCFQPAGACVSSVSATGGTTTRYASGSSMTVDATTPSSPHMLYYGNDGRLCYETTFVKSGSSVTITYLVNGASYSFDTTGSGFQLKCPDGTTASMNAEQSQAVTACSNQSGTPSTQQTCTYDVPGSCHGAVDCKSAEVCCAYSSMQICMPSASCGAVDGGVVP